MNRDDIIRMAREAGFQSAEFWPDNFKGLHGCVERFAALVAATEREIITDEFWMCLQSDLEHGVKALNEQASEKFCKEYPELSKFADFLEKRGNK